MSNQFSGLNELVPQGLLFDGFPTVFGNVIVPRTFADSLESYIMSLLNTQDTLNEANITASNRIQELQEEIERLKDRITTLEVDNSRLQSDVDRLEDGALQYADNYGKLKTEYDNLQDKYHNDMEEMRHTLDDLSNILHDPIELVHHLINSQINFEAMASQDPDYAPDQSPWDEFVESLIEASKVKMDKDERITNTANNMFLTIFMQLAKEGVLGHAISEVMYKDYEVCRNQRRAYNNRVANMDLEYPESNVWEDIVDRLKLMYSSNDKWPIATDMANYFITTFSGDEKGDIDNLLELFFTEDRIDDFVKKYVLNPIHDDVKEHLRDEIIEDERGIERISELFVQMVGDSRIPLTKGLLSDLGIETEYVELLGKNIAVVDLDD